VGRAMLETKLTRDFARKDTVTLSYGWNSVSSSGPLAWAAADVAFRGPGEEETDRSPDHRLTGVFEHRGDRWLIAQLHVSWPSNVD
jgi:ketosteroid isomerase-like protein